MLNDDLRVLKRSILDKTYIVDMIRQINPSIGQKLLDVGCSLGGSTEIIKRNFPCLEVYGIDIDKKNIEFAQKRSSNISYKCCDCRKTFFCKDFFDICFVRMLFETMTENWIEVLTEIKRISKIGGIVIINGNLKTIPDIYPRPRHYYEYILAEMRFERMFQSKVYSPALIASNLKKLGLKDMEFLVVSKNSANNKNQNLYDYYIEKRNYEESPLVKSGLIPAKTLEEYEMDLAQILLSENCFANFEEYFIWGKW